MSRMPRYRITRLPVSFTPKCLGSDGSMVGTFGRGVEHFTAGRYRNGVVEALCPPGLVGANAINAAGIIVGDARTPAADKRAVLFAGGQAHDLGALYGGSSAARDINDAGTIVGWINAQPRPGEEPLYPAAHDFRAAMYDERGWHDLGTLGGPYSNAKAINAHGEIVGYADIAPRVDHAFLYRPGSPDLSDLGVPEGAACSTATAINDQGAIVGYADYPDGTMLAVRFDRGRAIPLACLGGTRGSANAINNAGQAVGEEWFPLPLIDRQRQWRVRAVLWEADTVVALDERLVDSAGWQVEYARDIDDAGRIVGTGRFEGEHASFLLTPLE